VGSDPSAGTVGRGPEVIFQVSGGHASPTNLPDRSSTLAALGDTIFNSCPQPGPAQLTLLVWWRQTLAPRWTSQSSLATSSPPPR